MKAWRIHRYGSPSRALELDEVDRPQPAAGQVLIQVRSLSINANDIDGCYGRYKIVKPELPFTAGMELMGVVEGTGPGCEQWMGKRVIACPSGAMGGFAEYAVAGEEMVFEAPDSLDDVEAGAIFFPYHLAYLSLHTHGKLQSGETLLVHGASGGVGSAAIQLGVAAGARVIAVAGGSEKVAHCRAMGAHVVVDHQEEDFAEAVGRETDGRGVDVVCDLVGGSITQRTFPLVAFQGRHMMTGFVGGIQELDGGGYPPQPIVMGNFFLGGVLLSYSKDPQLMRKAVGFNAVPREIGEKNHAALMALFEKGAIRPPVSRVVEFEDLAAAMEAKEARETMGRVVVRLATSP
ncbi:MAG: NADPH:quinone oxidoreductase family protein [Deltaproteobacteria bacterium]|nr:NADPH:quinone oxidoreductase family protein [Deltaproteobacteria bacterium]MBW2361764.1 NADPH:quinone oxidoreductase family protein [Deltaproteobacteria bacterium]